MGNLKVFVVITVACLALGDDNVMPPGPDRPLTLPNNNATTETPSSSSASPITITVIPPSTKPTTTPPTTSTTTTKTTPQPPPNTTTTAPNITTTPTTTTSTTTLAPNTTTTPTTTTTAAPITTPPPLTPGKWSANYTKTNRTCLVLQAAIQVNVTYKDGNATKSYQTNVPPTALALGSCNSTDNETIALQFGDGNTVSFEFQKSKDKKTYDVEKVVVTLKANLPNATQFVLAHLNKEFSTHVGNSYKCGPERKLNLTAADKVSSYYGDLKVSHFQVQAFRNSTGQKFDEAVDCEGSETPDVVPIAVGCALAALVIIVLIAYLIGRRRSQARGYLSM